jgi:integrase/recombinase XerD
MTKNKLGLGIIEKKIPKKRGRKPFPPPMDHDKTKLEQWMDAFLIDRRSRDVAAGTIGFYKHKFKSLLDFCDPIRINDIDMITPIVVRQFLLWLEDKKGITPGGIHAHYRALRSLLLWWENEVEPANWKNPMKKVKPPRLSVVLLEPVEISEVNALLDTCDKQTVQGVRDRAMILMLLDTGVRAAELMNLKVEDIDLMTGSVKVILGKGRKSREVFIGAKTRKAVRNYISMRKSKDPYLWISNLGTPLTYWGLREVIYRRAMKAGMDHAPELHGFRRAFAINCLRSGMDVFTLKELMGHADLQVLQRYLKQTQEDLMVGHGKASPVDNMGVR